MKFIKAVAVLLAVSVSLMVPSFAWDSDSFVGQDFYFYEPVINYEAQSPSLMADSGTLTSVSGADFLSRWSISGSQYYVGRYEFWVPRKTVAGVSIPGYTGYQLYPAPTPAFTRSFSSSSALINFIGVSSMTVPTTYTDTDTYDVDSYISYGVSDQSYSSGSQSGDVNDYFLVDFDISSFPSFTAFSLSGTFGCDFRFRNSSTGYVVANASTIELLVNGSLVETFYPQDGYYVNGINGYIDFADFIYSGSVPVTSIQFRLSLPQNVAGPGDSFGAYYSIWAGNSSFPAPSFDILVGDDVVSGRAGSTQDDVNELEGLESQWGNSMTENFNALSLDSFTYPDGLTSGFALISGIFQDLWNAMGSYSILYVLPLTLAVVLLLIGRISKFAGQGRSSPSKEE